VVEEGGDCLMFFSKRSTISCDLLLDKIPLSTKLEELEFVVFDTEATGFAIGSVDRLIELAAVSVSGLRVNEDDVFQTYVNPNRQISREIIELTSITNERVASAPQALEAIMSCFDYVATRKPVCLVGHYVQFDVLLLKHELKRAGKLLKPISTIDTLDLIGAVAPSYDMRDLHRYSMAFGTRIYERHSALGDTLTTAHLFTELLYQLQNKNKTTLADLLTATSTSPGGVKR
jgi:DNA polymerase III subunit epsilon